MCGLRALSPKRMLSFPVCRVVKGGGGGVSIMSLFFPQMCGSRKYPYPPHGGSRKFRGVGGSENDKFPKGRGVTQTVFFPGGLK